MRKRFLLSLLGGAALFLAICFLSLLLGSREVGLEELLQAVLGKDEVSFSALVIRERIPRTIFGIMAGASLGISGLLMQAVTRNPIADPSILGVNMGASLFVVGGIVFIGLSSAWQYIGLALLGSILTAIFVYGVAAIGVSGVTPLKLALSGAAVSTALGSCISAILLSEQRAMESFRFWQVGSVGAATWEKISVLFPFFLVGGLLGIAIAPALNALALGDEMAISLGIRPGRTRLLASLAAVILCGACTAMAGPIGFVGLMVPHIVRLVLGGDLRYMLPVVALGGSCLLLFSDIVGRVMGRPGELEVGMVTAFIGAPVFMAIITRIRTRSI